MRTTWERQKPNDGAEKNNLETQERTEGMTRILRPVRAPDPEIRLDSPSPWREVLTTGVQVRRLVLWSVNATLLHQREDTEWF